MNVMNLVVFLALSKNQVGFWLYFLVFVALQSFCCPVAARAGQAIEQDIYFSRESGGRCSWALGRKAKTPFRHPISTRHSLEAFQKMPVNFRFFMFVCHMGTCWIRENTQIFGFQFADSASIPAGKKKHWGGNFHRDPQPSMCPCESKLPDSPNKLHVFQETCRFSWQNSDFYTSNSINDSRIISRKFQLLNLHDSHQHCILGLGLVDLSIIGLFEVKIASFFGRSSNHWFISLLRINVSAFPKALLKTIFLVPQLRYASSLEGNHWFPVIMARNYIPLYFVSWGVPTLGKRGRFRFPGCCFAHIPPFFRGLHPNLQTSDLAGEQIQCLGRCQKKRGGLVVSPWILIVGVYLLPHYWVSNLMIGCWTLCVFFFGGVCWIGTNMVLSGNCWMENNWAKIYPPGM